MDSENQDTPQELFDDWAFVELFGHNKIAGKVKTVSMLGAPFIRVDVPDVAEQKAHTRFYNPKSVYSISPTTKEIATAMVAECRSEPIQRYDLPKLLTNNAPEKYDEFDEPEEHIEPTS